MRCAAHLGRGSQAAQMSSRDWHSAEWMRWARCQEAPFHAPLLFSSCPLYFFIRNVHVCLRALALISSGAPSPSLSRRWLMPLSLCWQLQRAPLKCTSPQSPAPSQSPTCSSLQTHFSVTQKMGISPLHCPKECKGASDRKRENWDLIHFYKWMGGGKDRARLFSMVSTERKAMSFNYSNAQNTANII